MIAANSLRARLWPLRRILREIYPVKVPQPSWPQMLGKDFEVWRQLLRDLPPSAPRVLLAPTVGMPAVTALDSLLAVALTVRGARVHVLLCDSALPACQQSLLERMPTEQEFVRHGPQRALCAPCSHSGHTMMTELGVPVNLFGETITSEDRKEALRMANQVPLEQIGTFHIDGVPIGEHAKAGAIRFFARGALEREPNGELVLRRYLQASTLSYFSMNRLFDRIPFDSASFHHGIYVPQGIIGEVARRHGTRVANWAMSYRSGTFVFSHEDTYHHTMMSEATSNWEDMVWNESLEKDIVGYLKSRWHGSQDWIAFNRDPLADQVFIRRELGIDPSKPCIGLLTNVMWDAQLHYPEIAFPNMLDWLLTTIRHFVARPDLQLVIRVHPAELWGPIRSRQPVLSEIQREFPVLPPNIFIIPPESKISTYAAMMECDTVLIYATKTGVELTSFGVPVVVAGEAWIRNKGITTDIRSRDHYLEVLKSLPSGKRLPPEVVRRARMYAYHFFYRRMIPLKVLSPNPAASWSPYSLEVKSLDDLRPGRDIGLDVMCDGILEGRPFIYPAERVTDLSPPP